MKYTIICIGDSITEGVGCKQPSEYSYSTQLRRLLGSDCETVNCGRNGATLMQPRNEYNDMYCKQPQFEAALEAAKKAYKNGRRLIVSIMLGTNDADIIDYGFQHRGDEYYAEYHDEFIGDMFYIIDKIKDACPSKETSFIICKSPYSYDNIKHTDFGNLSSVWRFQQEVADLCKGKSIPAVINDIAATTSPEAIGENGAELFYVDRLHPNEVGHMYMAHFFAEAVKKLI